MKEILGVPCHMLRGVRVDVLPAVVAILLIGLRIFVYDVP
jgi:hypothetical protein